MGLIQRQTFWNTVIAYLGVLIGFVNAMILFPRFLEDDQVGLTRILQQASVIYAQFAALGAPNISLRFFPFFREQQRHNGFALFTFAIASAGVLIVTILIFAFKSFILNYYTENSPLFVEYFLLLIPLGIFTTFYNLFDAHARSVYRSVAPSFIKDVLLRLLISLCITGYAIGWYNFEDFILLFVLMNSIIALVLFFYLVSKKEIHLLESIRHSATQKKEMLQYGFYSLITGASNLLVITIDSMMIGAMIHNGLNAVAYYTTATFFIALQTMPARSMEKITYPIIADYWKRNELDKIDRLYKKVSVTNGIIGSVLFMLLWINIHDLYAFLPVEYSAGIICIAWIGLSRLFDMMTGINSIIIKTSVYYRYETLFNIIFVATAIVLNYFLIRSHGIQGAAIATAISVVFFNLLKCGFIYFKLGMWPFEKKHIWILLLGGAVVLAGMYLPLKTEDVSTLQHLLNLSIRSSIVLLLFVLPAYFLHWSEDINEMGNKILRRVGLMK